VLHRRSPLFLFALLLSLVACEAEETPCGYHSVLTTTEGAVLQLDRCTGQLRVGREGDQESWLSGTPEGTPALAWAVDDVVVDMYQGRYTFEGVFGLWRGLGEGVFGDESTWVSSNEERPARLSWSEGPRGSIVVRLEVDDEEVDRVSLGFGCSEGERFYGTGARPQGTEHSGSSPLLYTAEQGIGQIDYRLDELDLLRGRIGDSYFPVPWTVTDRGLGVGISGSPIARMYLCGEDEPGVLRFEAWERSIEIQIFPAESARDAVGDWTLAEGAPAPAPDWAYGPWVAVQHGSTELARTAEFVREEGIPVTALWAQDWIGGDGAPLGGYDLFYHWEWDEDLYPGLPGLIEDLHAQGFAFLGYFNPFVTQGFDEWDEAVSGGFLPKTPEGDNYEFTIVDRYGSVVDLSNQEAWDWTLAYMKTAAEMGQDGWMCDFGEWMPFDAQVGSGLGQGLHNAYPLLWQEVNMQALNEVLGVGNGLCFNRSGWAGTQRIAPVSWGGDQETSFARDDGLPTAREIGVGLGLSGIGRYGSDIAGFSSVWGDPSTKEVYWRWIELAAFEPVMRTHDGLAADDNWHWEEDEETLAHFARYARWHMRLLPYLQILDGEFMEQGLPFMRHSLLVGDPLSSGWESLRDAPDQHFLGDDLLVAPMVEEGAVARSVVLPPGKWFSLMGTEAFDGGVDGATVSIDAPLGTTVVLGRGGSVVPLGDPDVVTSYASTDPTVVSTASRSSSLDLVAFAGGDSTRALADGVLVEWSASTSPTLGSVTLNGVDLAPTCMDPSMTNCVDAANLGFPVVRVSWPEGVSVLSGANWTLSVETSSERQGTVELRGVVAP